ncbi:MAG: hypothetical protein NVSMB1_25950 [Polyangiales bacterium]
MDATADLTFGLIIDACRRVSEGDRLVRSGQWSGWAPTHHLGRRISSATLGIVGFGRIGRAVARRASGFGMRVLYASRRECTPEEAWGAEYAELDDLLSQVDIVTLHAPLTEETRGLLSRERLSSMRPGAIVINVARGAMLDEHALVDLLVSGHLGGAALDVFQGEPQINPRLLQAPRLVLTPHIGSADAIARDSMAALACEAIYDVLRGVRPRFEVASYTSSRESSMLRAVPKSIPP